MLADAAGCSSSDLRQIRRGDGLTAWKALQFDAVIGNPPFRNAIEGDGARQPRHPLIGGTADLAYRFLVRATELVRPGGVVAYIQPRPVLNAACLARFRASLPDGLRPNLIFAPDRSRLFPGALVFTCALVLGPNKMCRVSRDAEARAESWAEGPIASTNWWRAVNLLLNEDSDRAEAGACLGDRFEVWAGMTAGEAYDLRPFVGESPRSKSRQASHHRTDRSGDLSLGEATLPISRAGFLAPRRPRVAPTSTKFASSLGTQPPTQDHRGGPLAPARMRAR